MCQRFVISWILEIISDFIIINNCSSISLPKNKISVSGSHSDAFQFCGCIQSPNFTISVKAFFMCVCVFPSKQNTKTHRIICILFTEHIIPTANIIFLFETFRNQFIFVFYDSCVVCFISTKWFPCQSKQIEWFLFHELFSSKRKTIFRIWNNSNSFAQIKLEVKKRQ